MFEAFFGNVLWAISPYMWGDAQFQCSELLKAFLWGSCAQFGPRLSWRRGRPFRLRIDKCRLRVYRLAALFRFPRPVAWLFPTGELPAGESRWFLGCCVALMLRAGCFLHLSRAIRRRKRLAYRFRVTHTHFFFLSAFTFAR